MKLFLEILGGPQKGVRIAVIETEFTNFGGSLRADHVLPGCGMAAIHFSICWMEPQGFLLRDLATEPGTLVNGVRCESHAVRHGDRIQAGSAMFRAAFEGVEDIEPAEARKRRFLDIVAQTVQPPNVLYGLVDAARDPALAELLQEKPGRVASLFEGPHAAGLKEKAPHLAALPKGSILLDALAENGLGNAWATFVVSSASFAEVRRHFREFLMVEAPDGRRMYFRFYDPRVLRGFLPACTPVETEQFFGPVEFFLLEAETPDRLIRFLKSPAGAQREEAPLVSVQTP